MELNTKYPINVTKIPILEPETGRKYFFYTPQADKSFKILFGYTGQESKFKALVESITNQKLGNITLQVNTEFKKKYFKEKKQEVDAKAICEETGNIIIVEMQTQAKADMYERFNTYGERAHLEGLKSDSEYKELPKVAMIIILAENVSKYKTDENFIHIFNDRDKFCPKNLFSEAVTKYVVELPKYIKLKEKASPEEREKIINPWLEFIINPLGEEVKERMRTDKELREAVDQLRKLNSDEEVRRAYEDEEWEKYVEASERAAYINLGKAEGKAEVVKMMIANGISKEQIADILKIELSAVEEMIDDEKVIA